MRILIIMICCFVASFSLDGQVITVTSVHEMDISVDKLDIDLAVVFTDYEGETPTSQKTVSKKSVEWVEAFLDENNFEYALRPEIDTLTDSGYNWSSFTTRRKFYLSDVNRDQVQTLNTLIAQPSNIVFYDAAVSLSNEDEVAAGMYKEAIDKGRLKADRVAAAMNKKTGIIREVILEDKYGLRLAHWRDITYQHKLRVKVKISFNTVEL